MKYQKNTHMFQDWHDYKIIGSANMGPSDFFRPELGVIKASFRLARIPKSSGNSLLSWTSREKDRKRWTGKPWTCHPVDGCEIPKHQFENGGKHQIITVRVSAILFNVTLDFATTVCIMYTLMFRRVFPKKPRPCTTVSWWAQSIRARPFFLQALCALISLSSSASRSK